MLHSLSESSTWIACGIVMIYILEQGFCLAVDSALTQQRQGGKWEITRRPAAQLQQTEPMSGKYDGVHPTRFARFALPGSIERHDGNAEPNGEYGKIVRPGIPSGHGLRRVLGDLETCAEDIFMPFASETDPEQPVTVSGSKLRSCREAVFSLIRWLDTQRKEIHAPPEKNPYLQNHGLQDSNYPYEEKSYDKGENTVEKRVSMAKVKQHSCEITVCRPFERPHVCSYAEMPADKSKMCKMCNPRNEELIRRHCTKQRRRLRNILYLILGILIAVSSAAIVVVCLRKGSRDQLRVGPAYSSEQGDVLPGLMSTIRKSRGVDRRSDMERGPAARRNNMHPQFTPSQISPEQDGHVSPVRRSDSLKLRGCMGRTRPTTPTGWDEK
ncbi:hypothetical protein ACJ73_07190 [Blastomyces percursus]|uniref:Uncharacterized protein n=1 Tax=Blastomyces percursus TaxID=1658174 RepID=A0A1J9R1J2_9EURO|nr:hypothetical protein ACJ73_07190 [Blastomyces percursus]